jgi:putative peptide zinc metalloprotease protein
VDHDLKWCQAKIDESNAAIRMSRATDQNELVKSQAMLVAYQSRMEDTLEKQSQLTIKAPFTGRLVAPKLAEASGVFLPRGTEIGSVAVLDKLVIKGDIEQKDAELAKKTKDLVAEVRLSGMMDQTVKGGDVIFPPAAVNDLEHASQGTAGGGEIITDPHDPNGLRTVNPLFAAYVKLDNSSERYYAGQRAYVRLTLASKPLIWQWTRRMMQLFQVNDTGRWL